MTQSERLASTSARGEGDPRVARHVAIIMDGNGRWARSKGWLRARGHERGVEALRRTVEAAGELGITYLTVFSFSTENWRRPVAEVNTLFALLRAYVQRDLDKLNREGVRIRVIGQRDGLPEDIATLVDRAERVTLTNARFNLTIAFNYGAREELVRAARAVATAHARGDLALADINEAAIESHLDTAELPELDLMIRTSGEYRLSNFLLWQAAYAELVFDDVLWPDFGRDALERALETFAKRERRFGGVAVEAT